MEKFINQIISVYKHGGDIPSLMRKHKRQSLSLLENKFAPLKQEMLKKKIHKEDVAIFIKYLKDITDDDKLSSRLQSARYQQMLRLLYFLENPQWLSKIQDDPQSLYRQHIPIDASRHQSVLVDFLKKKYQKSKFNLKHRLIPLLKKPNFIVAGFLKKHTPRSIIQGYIDSICRIIAANLASYEQYIHFDCKELKKHVMDQIENDVIYVHSDRFLTATDGIRIPTYSFDLDLTTDSRSFILSFIDKFNNMMTRILFRIFLYQ